MFKFHNKEYFIKIIINLPLHTYLNPRIQQHFKIGNTIKTNSFTQFIRLVFLRTLYRTKLYIKKHLRNQIYLKNIQFLSLNLLSYYLKIDLKYHNMFTNHNTEKHSKVIIIQKQKYLDQNT